MIGINTAVILPQKQTNGIGFALPITPALLATVRELKQGREIVYGYVGMVVSTPTARERRVAGVERPIGARVDSIEPDTPAAGADLHAGDLIVSIGGITIDDGDAFVRVIGGLRVDRPANIELCREGERRTAEVTPRRREMPAVAVHRQTQRLRWQGLVLSPVPENLKSAAEGASGDGLMVVGMDESSPLISQGIALGSVITTVAGKTVGSIIELQQIIEGTPRERWEIGTASSAVMASNQ